MMQKAENDWNRGTSETVAQSQQHSTCAQLKFAMISAATLRL